MKITHQLSASGTGAHGFMRYRWLLFAAAGVAAIALGVQRWSQVASWLPFALVLLCPLMHFFHGSHGGHGKAAVAGNSDDSADVRPSNQREPG
ncbi:MAG: DUF2933 domain-containing protein [Cupriavidus necator]